MQAIPELPEPRWVGPERRPVNCAAQVQVCLPTCLPQPGSCSFVLRFPAHPCHFRACLLAGTRPLWPCWLTAACMPLVACCPTASHQRASTGAWPCMQVTWVQPALSAGGALPRSFLHIHVTAHHPACMQMAAQATSGSPRPRCQHTSAAPMPPWWSCSRRAQVSRITGSAQCLPMLCCTKFQHCLSVHSHAAEPALYYWGRISQEAQAR